VVALRVIVVEIDPWVYPNQRRGLPPVMQVQLLTRADGVVRVHEVVSQHGFDRTLMRHLEAFMQAIQRPLVLWDHPTPVKADALARFRL
jgi:hypothetical protein